MQIFHRLLGKIAESFDRNNIPYMVIGGQAVLRYGQPRLTEDIDITLGADSSKLAVVRTAAEEISLQPRIKNVESFVSQTNVLPLVEEESGIKVDCIFSFSPYEHEALQRAQQEKIGTGMVRFASVEDLLIHKLVAARPIDLEDIKGILLQTTRFDNEYLMYWLRSFSETLGRNIQAEFEDIKNSLKRKT